MSRSRRGIDLASRTAIAVTLSCFLVFTFAARASDLPDPAVGIGVSDARGQQLPSLLPFTDEAGRDVHLVDFLGRQPVILAPVAYICPNLCGSTLADLISALQRMPLEAGRDYQVLAVSLDPREAPADALAAKQRALVHDASGRLAHAAHFLTGPATSIAALTDAIGFRFRWDPQLQQYAHLSALAVVSADGRLSRWLAGIGLEPQDVRLALTEAGQGRVGGLAERFLLLCAHYDPKTGRYSGAIRNALQLGGVGVALAIAAPIAVALRRERRRRPRSAEQEGA